MTPVFSAAISPSGQPGNTLRPGKLTTKCPDSALQTLAKGEEHANTDPPTLEATIELLTLVRHGDSEALNRLLERCIPALRRWARGRLPQSARGMMETVDLVQDTVLSAMRRLDAFESRHQGALQAYMRQAVMNRIRDIMRQRQRRPDQVALPEQLVDEQTSPLDRLIGAENVARYEAAVQQLAPADREAIVGRIELEYSYAELAVVLNKPTADAARVAVTRAMKRLAEEMRRAPGQVTVRNVRL